mgnify:CR=1 FL=1
MLTTYAGLNRSIYVLFIAQVVNSVGHFVHPFLTLFLTRKLGMGPLEAGFYVTLSALAWVPSSASFRGASSAARGFPAAEMTTGATRVPGHRCEV